MGTSEADPLKNCLSSSSLVGQAINGKAIGDVVHVITKAGELAFLRLSLSRAIKTAARKNKKPA